jgi:hypothetical protein
MTPERRRLVALAAALAPTRAARLLGRLPQGEVAAAVALAKVLAGAPRRARLAALAAALAETPEAAGPGAPGLHPLLARLRREAAFTRRPGVAGWPPAEPRTLVRAAAHAGEPPVANPA